MMECVSESLEETSTGVQEMRRDCDPCKVRGDTTTGFRFCLDCQEVYCKACTDYHKAFKMSTHHWLINTKVISSELCRASFFTSFTKCPNHPDGEAVFYCKDHDAVFCAACFNSTHQLCNINIVSNHTSDVAKLREKSEEVMSQMQHALARLKHLKTITEKIKKLENKDIFDEIMSRVSIIKELTEAKVYLLDAINQHGSERQQFISAHLMKTQLKDIGKKLSEEEKNLKDIEAELKIPDDFRELIESTDIVKRAQVNVVGPESDLQHLGTATNYLRECKLVLFYKHILRHVAVHRPQFDAISMHADGALVLCDNGRMGDCGYLYLYNQGKGNVLKLELNRVSSVTQIDDTHLAVSSFSKYIIIVKVGNELKVEKTFKTQYNPGSIVALNNGRLAVAWTDPPAFSVIDISGTNIVKKSCFDEDRSGRKFKSFRHMADHIIQPCYLDKAVYCFDFEGEPVFRYSDPKLLFLQGVALDNCGNIYVCDYLNGCIHKLSPAGELISIIKKGIPSRPWAICSDVAGTGFWVTQLYSNDAVLYFQLEQNIET